MGIKEIATALRRLQAVLLRRPRAGANHDAPGMANWCGGARMIACHPGGCASETVIAEIAG